MEKELEQAVDQAIQDAFTNQIFIQSVVTSIIAVLGILTLRYALKRFVKGKNEILDRDQRLWINHINNATILFIIITQVFIWAPQLHTFALSLTAFAVAVVLSTKELIMCLTGGLLRASTKPFSIGDWIRVDDVMGEVMQINALSTVLEEIDTSGKNYHFTGRTIQIPNVRFLTANIENQNFIKSYIYHEIPITITYEGLDPGILMEELKKITEKYYAPYRENASKFNKKVERKAGVDFDDPDPRFFMKAKDDGNNIVFTVQLFMPTKEAASVTSNITLDFLKFLNKTKAKGAK